MNCGPMSLIIASAPSSLRSAQFLLKNGMHRSVLDVASLDAAIREVYSHDPGRLTTFTLRSTDTYNEWPLTYRTWECGAEHSCTKGTINIACGSGEPSWIYNWAAHMFMQRGYGPVHAMSLRGSGENGPSLPEENPDPLLLHPPFETHSEDLIVDFQEFVRMTRTASRDRHWAVCHSFGCAVLMAWLQDERARHHPLDGCAMNLPELWPMSSAAFTSLSETVQTALVRTFARSRPSQTAVEAGESAFSQLRSPLLDRTQWEQDPEHSVVYGSYESFVQRSRVCNRAGFDVAGCTAGSSWKYANETRKLCTGIRENGCMSSDARMLLLVQLKRSFLGEEGIAADASEAVRRCNYYASSCVSKCTRVSVHSSLHATVSSEATVLHSALDEITNLFDDHVSQAPVRTQSRPVVSPTVTVHSGPVREFGSSPAVIVLLCVCALLLALLLCLAWSARRGTVASGVARDPDRATEAVHLEESRVVASYREYLHRCRAIILAMGEEPVGVTVRFKDLTLTATVSNTTEMPRSLQGHNTVLRTMLRAAYRLVKVVASMPRWGKEEAVLATPVLAGLSGILRPGKMTALLGPPKSGKSTFLRALNGQIRTIRGKQCLEGVVKFNDRDMNELNVPAVCACMGQKDHHMPSLTARETLEFARQCRDTETSEIMEHGHGNGKLVAEVTEARLRVLLSVLGLTQCADTVIGDDSTNGVSGGEKRRISLAETLVMDTKVILLDELTTGLDAATAFCVTGALQATCHMLNVNVVASLVQPTPECLELFDEILMLDHGRLVYHGPREDVLVYFASLGFVKPAEKDVASFLHEVTNPAYNAVFQRTGSGVARVPASASEFAAAWEKTGRAKETGLELVDDSAHVVIHRYWSALLRRKKVARHWVVLARLVIARQWSVIVCNRVSLKARVIQNVVVGLLYGLLMFQLAQEEWYLRSVLLANFTIKGAFSASSLLPTVIAQRAIFYKQHKQAFYPAAVYVLADTVATAPLQVFDCAVFGTLIYFMCGLTLSDSGSRYGIFMLLSSMYTICMVSCMRCVAYVMSNHVTANSAVIMYTGTFYLFSGALATYDVIPSYWQWMYWLSPVMWANLSLQQTEYLSSDYTTGSNDPCTSEGDDEHSCGEVFLKARQMQTEGYCIGLSALVFSLYTAGSMALATAALSHIHHDDAFRTPSGPVESTHTTVSDAGTLTLETGCAEAASRSCRPTLAACKLRFKSRLCTLAFRDVVYTVRVPRATGKGGATVVKLLDGVTGYVVPFRLTAVMGTSGAGKTTLLDVLSGRKMRGTVEGSIRMNGRPMDHAVATQMGYVRQFGVHSPASTVRESLLFSAALRLPRHTDTVSRAAVVDETMHLLGLHPISDRLVGGPGPCFSLEETKRLTIAVEMVGRPSVLFLDEPTSGLDERAVANVVSYLRKIAATGSSVLCTIHQPSAAVFHAFDTLLLMQRGGRTVFFGSTSGGDSCVKRYFQAMSSVPPCAADANPATWMLDVVRDGADAPDSSADFVAAYAASGLCATNLHCVAELCTSSRSIGGSIPANRSLRWSLSRLVPRSTSADTNTTRRVGFATQLKLLVRRDLLEYWRTPQYTLVRVGIFVSVFLLLSTVYVDQQVHSAADLQSRVAVLHTMLQIIGTCSIDFVIPFLFERKRLFYRETASSMYHPVVFALSIGITESVLTLTGVSAGVNVMYWMVGFGPVGTHASESAWVYLYYWSANVLQALCMNSIGQALVYLLPSAESATLVAVIFTQLPWLFAGVVVPAAQVPSYLAWISYATPLRWSTEGVVSTQMQFYDVPMCYPTGTPDVERTACTPYGSGVYTTAKAYALGDPTLEKDDEGYPGFLGGEGGYQYDNRYYDLLALACFVGAAQLVVCRASCYTPRC